MRALLYIFKHTFINYLKSLRKKPVKAVGPVLMIVFIVLFMIPRRGDKIPAEPEMKIVFVVGFTLFAIGSLLFSMHRGTKKLKSYYLMSDVNLIFPAPIRPQTILVYGLVKQVAMELLVSFWFIYQIPNILRSFNVPYKNQILLIFVFIIFQIVLSNCLKLLVFALCARFKGLDSIIRWWVKLIALSLVIIPAAFIYINRSNLEFIKEVGLGIYNSAFVGYIPVIGWMKEIASQSIGTIGISFGIYVILLLIISGIFIYITYGIELDYYEDVLSAAEENEFTRKVKSGGLKKGDIDYTRHNIKAAKIFVNPMRRVRLKLDGVYGAKTFFYKHMNEYFKRGVWFVNFYSLLITVVSIIYALTPLREIKFLLFVFGGFLVYSSLGNKVQTEINYHYLYMVPDEAENKLFYSSASSLIKVAVDSILLFVPSGIMMGTSVIEIILCIITYISFGILCTFSGLFIYKIGGKIGLLSSQVLFAFFMLILQSLMLVPGIIIIVIVALNLGDFGSYSIYLAILSVNIVGSIAFIFGCRSMLDDMEQNSIY